MSGNNKSFLTGALFGGLVGGITALLFAPKSGQKLRKDISKKYDDLSMRAHDIVDEISEQAKELVERAKDFAEDAKDAAHILVKEKKGRSKR